MALLHPSWKRVAQRVVALGFLGVDVWVDMRPEWSSVPPEHGSRMCVRAAGQQGGTAKQPNGQPTRQLGSNTARQLVLMSVCGVYPNYDVYRMSVF